MNKDLANPKHKDGKCPYIQGYVNFQLKRTKNYLGLKKSKGKKVKMDIKASEANWFFFI